ncbi:MAG TPA: RNA polymerase sigma factor [Planctomycetota bacterium]
MHLEPLERDFAAWLDHRDAEALARVFDATGGKLLLLAAHLAGAGAAGGGGQDLVQATFVAAMARGASWDRTRPLWPWLAAILHNESRMRLRSARRRREVAIDAAGAVPAANGDPPTLAASQELLGTVLQAIDTLPLPYRQVLRLRLVHGLRPVDIARSLEVPVGTVRAQLHRGLEHLRSVLPLGVATMVAALLAGEDTLLAQVKTRVLGHTGHGSATAAAGAGGVVMTGGWWAMNAKSVGVTIAGCALLALLGFTLGVPESWWPRAADSSLVLPVSADVALAANEHAAAPTQPDRHAAVGAGDAVWPLVVTVRGKDGTPIPGASVTVWTSLRGSVYWYRDASEFGREDIAAGPTGADGVFRCSLDALRGRSQLAHRTTYLWAEATWPHGTPGYEIVELPRTREPQQVTATIELRECRALITGRVVDAAGAVVARAQVGTSRGEHPHFGNDAQTRSDGTFFVGWDGEAESWPDQLVVASPAHGIATVAVPAWIAEQRTIDLGTIVLQATDCVHGRAVLGDGSALAGIHIQAQAIDPSLGNDLQAIHQWLMRESRKHDSFALHDGRPVWNATQTHTLADGSFRFTGLRPDGVYLLSVWAVGAPADTVVRPGGDAVELRIDKQLLSIDVFDEHAAPVAGAQVRLAGYDPSARHSSYQKWPGFPETGLICSNWLPSAAPDGRRIFLAPFGFVFRVTVADDCVQPIAVRHDVMAGVYHATCRLDVRTETRFGKLHMCAVDENGAPINCGAYLKALDREQQIDDRRCITPPEGLTWDLPAGRWHVQAVLGKEVTYLHGDGGFARGFQEHVVTVEHGRTTQLKLVAAPAGLVAFDVHANDRAIASWRTLRVEEAGRALTVLQRDPNNPRPGIPDAATRFVAKQALAPGQHSFLLQADGYQPATCNVDVVADKLTYVRVEMFAR